MIILNAIRDFADGLSRGFSLFFTERRDHTARGTLPPDKPVHANHLDARLKDISTNSC